MPKFFVLVAEPTSKECKDACRMQDGCGGIEYSIGRCELWIRPEGIEAKPTVSEGLEFWTDSALDRPLCPSVASRLLTVGLSCPGFTCCTRTVLQPSF